MLKINYKIQTQIIISACLLLSTSIFAQNNALVLNGGLMVLSGGTGGLSTYLVVNQSNTNGIIRNSGHIHSENQYNYVKWITAATTGNYLFPFGIGGNASDYIPFTFNKTLGNSSIMMSTWATDTQNLPKPAATNVGAVTNMFGTADSVLYAIDRFWDIQTSAPTTADLTFSYRGSENTTSSPTNLVMAQHWNGTSWDAQVGPGNAGVTTGIGTTGPFIGQNTFSPWVLSVIPICLEDTISYAGNPYCNNLNTPQPISHTNGAMVGTYSAIPVGLSIDLNTGAIIPSLSTPGTYTVTFVVPSTPTCPDYVASTSVTISPMDDATFTYLQSSYCLTETNPLPNSITLPGGTFTINGGGVITGTTGEINLTATGIGNFVITYITNGICPDTATFNITINSSFDATIDTTGVNSFCLNDLPINITTVSSGGIWSGVGITNTTDGTFDPAIAGAGTHQIIYTISGSCGNADTINILVNPLPTITVPNSGQVCIGSTINLTPSTGGTWTSSDPTVATIDNTGLVTGINSGTVTMTFTDATTGCSSSAVSGTVTVNPLPTIIVPNSGQVCIGSTINLTPSTGGTWTSSDPAVATIDNTGLVTGINSGTVTITFTDATTGCSSSAASGTVTVNPLPTITVPNSGQVCIGNTINLTPSTGGTWTSSDPTVATIDNTGLVTGINSGTASMTFTDATTGCSSSAASGTVTVNPLPNAVNQTLQLCEDATTPGLVANVNLTLSDNSINGGVGINTWFNDAGLTSPVVTSTSTTVSNGQVFYVEVYNGMCTSVATITYTVTTTIALNTITPIFCEDVAGLGSTANINLSTYNTSVFIGTSPTYTWYQDAGLTSPIIPPTNTIITNGLTLYVDIIDGTCNNNIGVTFTVNPLPTITVPNSGQVCIGNTINLTPSTGGTWTSSDPTVATIDNTGLVTGINSGTASMTFTDATTGCSSSAASGTVTVNPLPTIIVPNSGQVCIGSTINLTPSTGGTWTSSDPTVATIDNTGLVTGINSGTVTMTFMDATTGCSSNAASGLVIVNPFPTITVSNGGILCKGTIINLSPSSGGSWSSSDNTIATVDNYGVVTGAGLGNAIVTFTDATTGCSTLISSGLITVIGVNAVINATPTSGSTPLNVFFGNGSTTGATITYNWNFGNGNIDTVFEPTQTYNNTGIYLVTLIVTDGVCYDSTTITIDVIQESVIIIPNVFTPNDDGSNDLFTINGINITEIKGEIFNRWGQKLYEWNNLKGGWDGRTLAGTIVPDGTYFYIINAKGGDDKTYFHKGTLILFK